MTECALLERNPRRRVMSRLGTGSDQVTIVTLIRQARGVVVAVMWMSLRCDSDKTTSDGASLACKAYGP